MHSSLLGTSQWWCLWMLLLHGGFLPGSLGLNDSYIVSVEIILEFYCYVFAYFPTSFFLIHSVVYVMPFTFHLPDSVFCSYYSTVEAFQWVFHIPLSFSVLLFLFKISSFLLSCTLESCWMSDTWFLWLLWTSSPFLSEVLMRGYIGSWYYLGF